MKTLRRVILDESKNAKKQRAALAAKIQKRGGPRNEREDDIVLRQDARKYGVKPNASDLEDDFVGRFRPTTGEYKRTVQSGQTAQQRQSARVEDDRNAYSTGRVADRQSVRRTGKASLERAKARVADEAERTRTNQPPRKRDDKVKRVGPSGRKDPEQENSNTAYPLTAGRVFMFERTKAELKQKARGETAQERELRRERVYRKFTKSGRNPSKLGMKSANAITRKGEEVPGGVKAEHDWRSEKGIGQGSRAKEKRLDGYSSEKARKEAGDDYDDYVKTRDDAWRNR